MAFVQWNDGLSVGVAQVDQQHKRLFAMINAFHDAIGQNQAREHVGKLLTGLIDYTKSHFAMEEKLLKQHGYWGVADHETHHRALEQKANDMKSRFERNQLILTVEITNCLRDWLTTHIQGTDKKYAPFLHSKGVK